MVGQTIPMTPIGLDRADVDAVVAILHDAEQPLIWLDDLTDSGDAGDPVHAVDTPAEDAVVEGGPADGEPRDRIHDGSPFEPMDHAIVVKLLGGVDVTDVNGVPGQFERSKTVELIAWLATHRAHSTRTRGPHGVVGVGRARRHVRQRGVGGPAGARPVGAATGRRGVVGTDAHRSAAAAPIGRDRCPADRRTAGKVPARTTDPRDRNAATGRRDGHRHAVRRYELSVAGCRRHHLEPRPARHQRCRPKSRAMRSRSATPSWCSGRPREDWRCCPGTRN